MIHTARQSPKFKMFIRRLRPIAQNPVVDVESIGVCVLERLWHQTSIGAKRGDIGKFDDELIAEECGWLGDATTLIDILVDSGYLDRCSVNRLVVHDWSEHAPNHVKGVITKGGEGWATTVPHLGGNPSPAPRSATQSAEPPNQTNSNQTQPTQTNQIQTPPEQPESPSQPEHPETPRLPGVGVFPEIPEEVRSEALDSAWKTYCGWVAAFGEGVNEVGMMAKLQELLKRPGGEAKWIKDLEETVCSARVNGKIFDSDRTFGSNGSSPKSSTSNLPEYKRGET